MSDAFDPSRYLTKLGRADYLEVKWRLVWLRAVHPDAHLSTELIHRDDQHAIFCAKVALPNGGGSATGWGSESYGDFRDFLEKAETKAIGRALAALGFGTQFTPDHEGVVSDAPVEPGAAEGRDDRPAVGYRGHDAPVVEKRVTHPGAPPSKLQIGKLAVELRNNGIDPDAVMAMMTDDDGDYLFSKGEASAWIDALVKGEVPKEFAALLNSTPGAAVAAPGGDYGPLAANDIRHMAGLQHDLDQQKKSWHNRLKTAGAREDVWEQLLQAADYAVVTAGPDQAWRYSGMAIYAPSETWLEAIVAAADVNQVTNDILLTNVGDRMGELDEAANARS